MKIKLEFEGDQYDDNVDINCVIHANDMYASIIRVKELIRVRLKYGENITDIEQSTLVSIREALFLKFED
jgi:hypothetical protein